MFAQKTRGLDEPSLESIKSSLQNVINSETQMGAEFGISPSWRSAKMVDFHCCQRKGSTLLSKGQAQISVIPFVKSEVGGGRVFGMVAKQWKNNLRIGLEPQEGSRIIY
jgi:hypothetical protein